MQHAPQPQPGTSDSAVIKVPVAPQRPVKANNKYHLVWRQEADPKLPVCEQDLMLVTPDRLDLFPPADFWKRLDLPSGLILFIRRPLV